MSGSKSILIVEDDQFIRESIQELLEGEGYTVLTAEHGGEALKLLESSLDLPKLILLDLMMPVKDGFAFRDEQALNPKLAAIPVIVMSADGNIHQKKARLGAIEYLKKPIDIDQILSSVKRIFD